MQWLCPSNLPEKIRGRFMQSKATKAKQRSFFYEGAGYSLYALEIT